MKDIRAATDTEVIAKFGQMLATTERTVANNCLLRIRDLRVLLDHIEKRVKNPDGILNDLGEMQGVAVILDCRLAGLATLRRIKDDFKDVSGFGSS